MENKAEVVATLVEGEYYHLSCTDPSKGTPVSKEEAVLICRHPGWSMLCEACDQPIATAPLE